MIGAIGQIDALKHRCGLRQRRDMPPSGNGVREVAILNRTKQADGDFGRLTTKQEWIQSG